MDLPQENLSNLLPKLELKPVSKNELYLKQLGERANVIVDAGHTEREIINVVMQDLKRLGGPTALMQMSMGGQLTKAQFHVCETIGVKLLAICAMQNSKLNP